MSGIFIVGAKRTAFGSFGGALKNHTATDLATLASQAALSSASVDPAIVSHSFFGNVAQTSADAAYLARHAALRSGVPITTPALTLNRLCGSGFQAVMSGADAIRLGQGDVMLCGGTESMSQAPLSAFGHHVRNGVGLGKGLKLEDTLWSALTDSYAKVPMGITAENLARKYSISREETDAFAARSQTTWGAAQEAGVFADEIVGVEYKGRKGMETLAADEGPRPGTSVDSLAKLRPVFDKNGVVTAGNASGITDGAAALLVASEAAVKQHGLTPLARIVAYSVVGVEPTEMGIGPAPAIRNALEQANLSLDDMGVIEINEAFAAQTLACAKELDIPVERLNESGGAIALGHPLGASGARITAHLAHALHRRKEKYAIGSACIGGGQGIAIILEVA